MRSDAPAQTASTHPKSRGRGALRGWAAPPVTRHSQDTGTCADSATGLSGFRCNCRWRWSCGGWQDAAFEGDREGVQRGLPAVHPAFASRSEEHTSELQSRQYLVCRLLLEKKKKRNIRIHTR